MNAPHNLHRNQKTFSSREIAFPPSLIRTVFREKRTHSVTGEDKQKLKAEKLSTESIELLGTYSALFKQDYYFLNAADSPTCRNETIISSIHAKSSYV